MMKATAWDLSIIALFKIYKKKKQQQQKKDFREHKIKIKTKGSDPTTIISTWDSTVISKI